MHCRQYCHSWHDTDNQSSPALCDKQAWGILQQFLTTNMTMPDMDNALASYLGDRYFADDWVEPRRALFSGEGDDGESLANLNLLMARHVSPTPPASKTVNRLSSSHRKRSRRQPKVSKILWPIILYT